MKNLFWAAIAAVLALASCEKEIDEPTDELQKVSENFTFKSIEFLFDENSEMKFETQKFPASTIRNDWFFEMRICYDPRRLPPNRITFGSSDKRAFKLVDEEVRVEVPWRISETGIELSDNQWYDSWYIWYGWYYAKGEQLREQLSSWSESDIVVPPRHSITLSTSYRFRTLSTRYRLHLKGVEEGEEITVDGLWTGRFLDAILQNDVHIEPLD